MVPERHIREADLGDVDRTFRAAAGELEKSGNDCA